MEIVLLAVAVAVAVAELGVTEAEVEREEAWFVAVAADYFEVIDDLDFAVRISFAKMPLLLHL